VAGRQRTQPRRAGPCRRGIQERQAHRTTRRIGRGDQQVARHADPQVLTIPPLVSPYRQATWVTPASVSHIRCAVAHRSEPRSHRRRPVGRVPESPSRSRDQNERKTSAKGGEAHFALAIQGRLWHGLRSFPRPLSAHLPPTATSTSACSGYRNCVGSHVDWGDAESRSHFHAQQHYIMLFKRTWTAVAFF